MMHQQRKYFIVRLLLLVAVTTPIVLAQKCSVCGVGKTITKKDSIFEYPGQPAVDCKTLEVAGETGLIPSNECSMLPPIITDTCGCMKVNTPGSCNVCGPGKKISKEDTMFSYPGQPTVTCKQLEHAGQEGVIPLFECSQLPLLINSQCGCVSDGGKPTAAPTPRPPSSVAANNPAPTSSNSNKGCSVCGNGMTITKPDETFEFPGQPAVNCKVLETAGENGLVPLEECAILKQVPDFVDTCGCQEIRNVNAYNGDACSVCGPGKKITKEDVMFSYPGQPTLSCKHLEDAGKEGAIGEAECNVLPSLITQLCGCSGNFSSGGRNPTPSPTRPPTRNTNNDNNNNNVPPSFINSPSTTDKNIFQEAADETGMPTAAIISIVVGVLITLILSVVFCFVSRSAKKQSDIVNGKDIMDPEIKVTETEIADKEIS